jgi:single-stranded-DNA-specific exonuclease
MVITSAKGKAKGSGRSIEGYDMFEEISKCRDILLGAGGHPMAAGFSLVKENITLFREKLNKQCTLTEEDLIYKIDVDEVVGLEDVTFDLAASLEKLEPYGKGNSEPLFMAENLVIDRIFLMGQNQEHFRLFCRDPKTNTSIQAVSFYETDCLKKLFEECYGEDRVNMAIQNPSSFSLKMDLLFKPAINEWNNNKTIQMQLVDYRISE